MKADSQTKTGIRQLEGFTREALLFCVTTEDIQEQVQALREIIQTGGNRDKIQAIRLIWDYAMAKPPQGVEFGSGNEGFDSVKIEIVKKKDDTTESTTEQGTQS